MARSKRETHWVEGKIGIFGSTTNVDHFHEYRKHVLQRELRVVGGLFVDFVYRAGSGTGTDHLVVLSYMLAFSDQRNRRRP